MTSLVAHAALRHALAHPSATLTQNPKLYQACQEQCAALQPPALLVKSAEAYSLLDKVKARQALTPHHPLLATLQKVHRSLLALSQALAKASEGGAGHAGEGTRLVL